MSRTEQPHGWRREFSPRRQREIEEERQAALQGDPSVPGHSHYYWSAEEQNWKPYCNSNCRLLRAWLRAWEYWERKQCWPNPPHDN